MAGADTNTFIRQFAEDDHELDIATFHGFIKATIEAVKMNPDVYSEQLTGLNYEHHANISCFTAGFYQGAHATRLIAGVMTKTNWIAYIAGYRILQVSCNPEAFTSELHSVSPMSKFRWCG